MSDLETNQKEIQELPWPQAEKDRFLELWKQLDNSQKEFFFQEATAFGSEFIFADLNKALANLVVANQAAKKNSDSTPWLKILKESIDNPVYDLGRYLLPFLSNIRILRSKTNQSQELLAALIDFDIALIDYLNPNEFVAIFKENLLAVLGQNIEILEKIKKLFNSKNGFNATWILQMLSSMENNEEILGKENISIDSTEGKKVVAPYIKNWIYDFNVLTNRTVRAGNMSGYDIAHYLANSKNVSGLDQRSKNLLLDVLQIYEYIKFGKFEASGEEIKKIKNKYIASQNFQIPKESTSQKEQTLAPSPAKKLDVQEILNQGSGVRMGAKEEISNSQFPISNEKQGGSSVSASNFAKATADLQKATADRQVKSRTQPLPNPPLMRGGDAEQKKPAVLPKVSPPVAPAKKDESGNATSPALKGILPSRREEQSKPEDLNQIRRDIEKKKQLAQMQIEKKLENLRRRKK